MQLYISLFIILTEKQKATCNKKKVVYWVQADFINKRSLYFHWSVQKDLYYVALII